MHERNFRNTYGKPRLTEQKPFKHAPVDLSGLGDEFINYSLAHHPIVDRWRTVRETIACEDDKGNCGKSRHNNSDISQEE